MSVSEITRVCLLLAGFMFSCTCFALGVRAWLNEKDPEDE